MTSTTTTYYHHHRHPTSTTSGSKSSSSTSTLTRNYSSSSSTSSTSSSTSKYSGSSSGTTTSSSKHHYLPPSFSNCSHTLGSSYKTRSSYDLNNSSSISSSYTSRPSYLSSPTSSSSNTFTSKSYLTNNSSPSSYLSKYSSSGKYSSQSLIGGYSSDVNSNVGGPVTLTKFYHRRSSFDYNDTDNNSGNTNKDKFGSKNPVAGLENLGNTCYMNSVLQALYALKQFRDFIISGTESGQLYLALCKLFKEMSSTRSSCVDPTIFRETFIRMEPKFKGYKQHDAQEFLSYLTTALHDEQNKATKTPSRTPFGIIEPKSAQEAWMIYKNNFSDSKFVDLFVGQFSSVIKCSDCGNESTCWDPFWDISLPVPRNRSRVDIKDCLAEFTEAETLDGNEKPFCSKCKQHRKSTKRLSIVRSPKILVIHVKKFSNNGIKLSSDIIVNQQIKIDNNSNSSSSSSSNTNHYHHHNNNNHYSNDISSSSSSSNTSTLKKSGNQTTTYELYACVCHHGVSSSSGHYTSYCRYDSKWYHCNDKEVKSVVSNDSFSMDTLKDAYVLFYINQDSHYYSSSSASTTYSSSSPSSSTFLSSRL